MARTPTPYKERQRKRVARDRRHMPVEWRGLRQLAARDLHAAAQAVRYQAERVFGVPPPAAAMTAAT